MKYKKLSIILAMVVLSVTLTQTTGKVYATETPNSSSMVDDGGNNEPEKPSTDDGKGDGDSQDNKDKDKDPDKITKLEKSIKEKQDELDKAKKEKKQIQGDLSNVQKMLDSLQSQKDNLNEYVEQLDLSLEQVQAKITTLKEMIVKKEAEVDQAQSDLDQAELVRDDQYQSMKSRIKFMYEKGNNYYMDMLFSSSSFGDMVNKADYIEEIAEYDRRMLEEYRVNCEYIEACRDGLSAEKDVLEEAKAQVDAEEENLNVLIEEKQGEIERTENSIANKEQAIREYEAYIAEQASVIKALEAAVLAEQKQLAQENGTIMVYDGGNFCWPAPKYTYISSEYGNRMHPTLGINQFHNGLDMAAPGGSPILAAYDGVVAAAAYSSTMGNYLIINHGDGLYTIYMHASALYVSEGTHVVRGQSIAAVGTTGRSTGNHLHFSVRLNGSYVSPWNYISAP